MPSVDTYQPLPRIESPCRETGGKTRLFITDGMPVNLADYPFITRLLLDLRLAGYTLLHQTCHIRALMRDRQFVAVGEIAAQRGEGELIYRFTPNALNEFYTLDYVITQLRVEQAHLLYNGQPLPMGKGQHQQARQLAKRLAGEHPLVQNDTPIFIPCQTRKGRGGWGHTVADKTYTRKDLLE